MSTDKSRIKNILVIKFGGIGDILLTTPVFPNLRAFFPDAVINVLTLRNARDILIDNPYITRAFTYDPNEDKSWCLIKNIRKQKYDLIIDLYGNPRTALITFISGAKYRFGFKFRGATTHTTEAQWAAAVLFTMWNSIWMRSEHSTFPLFQEISFFP